MYETEQELGELQLLLDRSMNRAGAQVRSIFADENRLSARQICTYMQGVKQVAAATVSSRGEPRVAPIDSVLFHGKFYISTDLLSFRAKDLRKRPAISLTYFESADPVIIVHGAAAFIEKDHQSFASLDSEWVKAYGKSILQLSETVTFIQVESRTMLAYAFHPERFQDT